MAQAKARASTKRPQGSKTQARSRGSSSKPRSSGSKPRSLSSRSRSAVGRSNGAARVESARHVVEHTAKDAGHAVGRAATKAKMPLVAGGAALVGAAGGLAIGTRQARHKKTWVVPRRPQVKVKSSDMAKVAKEVGAFSAQLGHLASELQGARENANSGGHRRSPVEVVLEGLTARRLRD